MSACFDCGRPYAKGPDLVIPNDAWAEISPTGDGGGFLCPNCTNDRLESAGLTNVPARFTSGPMACPDSVTEKIFIDRAIKAEGQLDRVRAWATTLRHTKSTCPTPKGGHPGGCKACEINNIL